MPRTYYSIYALVKYIKIIKLIIFTVATFLCHEKQASKQTSVFFSTDLNPILNRIIMMRSDVLTKTIFGLVLSLCQTAHSLETGCDYLGNVSVDKDLLHHDLKCTYMYSALTHMLVTKRLADPPISLRTSSVIGKVIRYNAVLKTQIYSLYRLNVTRMDALWILNLYMGMVLGVYENSSNKEEDGRKIIATHGYIIGKLREDLTRCREDNSFNKESVIDSFSNPTEKYLIHFIDMNVDATKYLLKRNKHKYVGTALQVGNLLLNNIGAKDENVDDLMNAFNVEVEWSSTGKQLRKSWEDSHNILNWPSTFESLKLYYKLAFDFLKIMIFRLSLKHLDYLEHFITSIFYVEYAQGWYDKVKEFADMLSLSEDLHVENLLIHLDMLVKREETIDDVVKYLNSILGKLCEPFECEATKKFELYGNEFQTPYKSWIANYDLNLKKSPVKIERYSLENTRAFLCYLREMFKYNNFDLVRLLVEYINEMKM